MFSFLKPKARLIDLLPTNYVDIHSHVLPGIDDGAKTIEDSQFLLENMIAFGFSKIITSPHTINSIWNNTPQTINDALSLTKEKLPLLSKKVELSAASEYMLDEHFETLCKEKDLLILKDNYILVEMPFINPPIQLFDYLFELQLAGYIPVLAHPERYLFYHSNFEAYSKLKKVGCYFQMNLLSPTGYYGRPVAKAVSELLKNNMIDFVGSDFHHKNHIASFSNPIIIKEIDQIKQAAANNCLFI